jgi:origin recognition complex subunit 3
MQLVHDFFQDVPDDVRAEEDEVISRVDMAHEMFTRDASAEDISDLLGNWLLEYFRCVPPSSLRLLI